MPTHPSYGQGRGSTAAPSGRARLLAAVTWILPFALVLYLGLRGGGFDSVVRDQAGVVLWLGILIAAVAGFLPAMRVSRAAWIALAMLAGFVAWTALGALWSDSVERTLDMVPLVGAYLAVFALSVMTSGRATVTRTLGAVGAAIAVIAGLALLSRYVPEWFPADETAERLPEVAARLKYPLGTWNGLAGFVAMGIPLLLSIVIDARSLVARAAAAAAVPVAALVIAYTLSRGGLICALAAVAVFVALHPRRMQMLPELAALAAGCVVALLAASRYDELKSLAPGFESQQAPMLAITIAIAVATGLALLGVVALRRRGSLPSIEVSARTTRRLVAGGAAMLAVGAIAVGASGAIGNAWDSFKRAEATDSTSGRIASAGGNLRYQQWDVALEASGSALLTGRGPGTYEYWWARESEVPGYNRYAHSLYFETLAESGLVGALLVTGFVALVIVAIVRGALPAPAGTRGWLAGAAAAAVAFALTMAIDWAWHVPVVGVAFLLVAAAALQVRATAIPTGPRRNAIPRVASVACAVPLLALTVVSWVGAQRFADSEASARDGDPEAALDSARGAESVEPWAATPHLQQALVLEQQGELTAAASEAAIAVEKDPFNWEPRWVLSRIEEAGGNDEQALIDFRAARELNPLSPFFTNDEDESALTPDE